MIVVITGASAGVGRALARELARRGARLGLIARDEARLHNTLEEVRQLGSDGVAIACDVADASGLDRAAERVEAELGPIDVWINNAMATVLSPTDQLTIEELRRVTDVTYFGAVYGTLAALKRMKPRDRGHIIQVGSALAYRGIPLQAAYCGAKHALRGYTDSLRSELMHDGSHVFLTMAQLPALNTPQFSWCRSRMPEHPQPVPPIFEPEVAALAIVDVIGHRRREIFVGWPTWKTVLGQMFVPGYVDRYLAKNGYSGQQTTSVPYDPDRPDNLFDAVPGDYEAHGAFGHKAKPTSAQSTVSRSWTRVRAFAERLLSLTPPSPALPKP